MVKCLNIGKISVNRYIGRSLVFGVTDTDVKNYVISNKNIDIIKTVFKAK